MQRAAALIVLLAILLLPAAYPAWAGPAPGLFTGAVVNRYGEPLKGAVVRAEHLQEGFVVESIADDKGTYVITKLPPGEYKLEASLSAKKTEVAVQKASLAPGQKKTLNFVINIKESLGMDPNFRPLPPGMLGSP